MSAKNITFTESNLHWLNQKIHQQGSNVSASDLINDLVKRQRQSELKDVEILRAALEEGEESGLTNWKAEDVRAMVLERLEDDH